MRILAKHKLITRLLNLIVDPQRVSYVLNQMCIFFSLSINNEKKIYIPHDTSIKLHKHHLFRDQILIAFLLLSNEL